MKKSVIVPAALLAALLGAVFVFYSPKPTQQSPPAVAPAPPAAAKPAEPTVQYPLAEVAAPAPEEEVQPAAPEVPLPPGAEDVDAAMRQLLALLGGQKPLTELFILDHFIQRFVVTVDNLPNKELPRKQLPIKGASGSFQIRAEAGNEGIHPDNARRYTPFVALAEALDDRELADLYVRLYPEFQKAYDELGQPKAYFNDRLIAVIDHLLATPEPPEPILLQRPNIRYQFADPELEEHSAGQKILLRIGADNRARLKAKLQGLRAELLTRVVAPPTKTPE